MEYPNESMTLPTEVLKKYISPVFVETGSHDGRTIQQALDVGFQRVISVEIDHDMIQICRERFQLDPRVEIWEGDSLNVLWNMIEKVDQPITYWLDAHIQDSSVIGIKKVPLLDELCIISQHPVIQQSIIMIDDKRLFGSPDSPDVWQPITEQIVINMLCMIIHDSLIVYEDSKAASLDIIVARAGIRV